MPVASMTGFARSEGESHGTSIVWEIRSVNGKGLELRMRLPQGQEAIEAEIRRMAGARLSRGNVQVALTLRRSDEAPVFAVNEALLAQVLALSDRLVASGHAVTPTSDGILALKGIIEVSDNGLSPESSPPARESIVEGFASALDGLLASRSAEGAALKAVLDQRLAEISRLIDDAEADPARRPETIRARLSGQVRDLMQSSDSLDPARLHQEVALLVGKSDIREEIDRLRAHVVAASALLADAGPIGRRLEFLSQEFHRESNTVCAKSNATSLTAIGLDLKVVVDQFREQVQNIE